MQRAHVREVRHLTCVFGDPRRNKQQAWLAHNPATVV